MTDLDTSFKPDWISPPGDTLSDLLEERRWTQAELARRLGLCEKHFSQLINGKVPLTADIASLLERVLGGTAAFWLRRETIYREHLERKRYVGQPASWAERLGEP